VLGILTYSPSFSPTEPITVTSSVQVSQSLQSLTLAAFDSSRDVFINATLRAAGNQPGLTMHIDSAVEETIPATSQHFVIEETAVIVSYTLLLSLVSTNASDFTAAYATILSSMNSTAATLKSNIESGIWTQEFQTSLLESGTTDPLLLAVTSNAVTVSKPAVIVNSASPTIAPSSSPSLTPTESPAADTNDNSRSRSSDQKTSLVPVWISIGAVLGFIILIAIVYRYVYHKQHFSIDPRKIYSSDEHSEYDNFDFGLPGVLESSRSPRSAEKRSIVSETAIILGNIYDKDEPAMHSDRAVDLNDEFGEVFVDVNPLQSPGEEADQSMSMNEDRPLSSGASFVEHHSELFGSKSAKTRLSGVFHRSPSMGHDPDRGHSISTEDIHLVVRDILVDQGAVSTAAIGQDRLLNQSETKEIWQSFWNRSELDSHPIRLSAEERVECDEIFDRWIDDLCDEAMEEMLIPLSRFERCLKSICNYIVDHRQLHHRNRALSSGSSSADYAMSYRILMPQPTDQLHASSLEVSPVMLATRSIDLSIESLDFDAPNISDKA
jgi:hypothetical protein